MSTPTIDHAAGMLRAIASRHVCTEACTGTVTLGDGKVVALTCPYDRLAADIETDASARRTVQSMYASEALAALHSGKGAR